MIVAERFVCFSIDVERDYRLDGEMSTRGISEGLPRFIDVFKSQRIPFDLMVSGEIVERVSPELVSSTTSLAMIGCHGYSHNPGYLNRLSSAAQESELRLATDLVRRRFHKAPIAFRAPNFSANGGTIRVLRGLGYRVDSSVLPGRLVRKWRVLPRVDHRGTPQDPYPTDEHHFPMRGEPGMLEVPVTPNRALPGGPLGLGFLHSHGSEAFVKAAGDADGRYLVVLGHSWEMVPWTQADRVAPWVRTASSGDDKPLEDLIASFASSRFGTLEDILRIEGA